MGKSRIKVILCDLGNVLVDFNHRIAAQRVSHFCAKDTEEIFKLFFDAQETALFERGKLLPEEFYTRVKELLGLKLSYDSFVPIWNEIFFLSPKNRKVYRLINSLKADYQTALLSNINILHYGYLKKNFPVFDVFHRVFLSYELGLAKPDKLIYREVISRLGVSAEEIFYTDDRPELIESASILGIKSFVFKDAPGLLKDLASLDIVPAGP